MDCEILLQTRQVEPHPSIFDLHDLVLSVRPRFRFFSLCRVDVPQETGGGKGRSSTACGLVCSRGSWPRRPPYGTSSGLESLRASCARWQPRTCRVWRRGRYGAPRGTRGRGRPDAQASGYRSGRRRRRPRGIPRATPLRALHSTHSGVRTRHRLRASTSPTRRRRPPSARCRASSTREAGRDVRRTSGAISETLPDRIPRAPRSRRRLPRRTLLRTEGGVPVGSGNAEPDASRHGVSRSSRPSAGTNVPSEVACSSKRFPRSMPRS